MITSSFRICCAEAMYREVEPMSADARFLGIHSKTVYKYNATHWRKPPLMPLEPLDTPFAHPMGGWMDGRVDG